MRSLSLVYQNTWAHEGSQKYEKLVNFSKYLNHLLNIALLGAMGQSKAE